MSDLTDLVRPDGPPRRYWPVPVQIALCALTLLLSSAILREFTPIEDAEIFPRFRYLEEHADEVSLIFVGTSRTQRQIDPPLFDAILTRGGYPMRSFNFGIPAMNGAETLNVLERIAQLRLPRLEWLLIDPGHLRTEIRDDNIMSDRVWEWHDLRGTLRALDQIQGEGMPPEARFGRARAHLFALARHYSGLGRGWRLLARGEGSASGTPNVPWREGYAALEWEPRLKGRHERYKDRLDEYMALIEPLPGELTRDRAPLRGHQRRYIAALHSIFEDHAARAAYFIAQRNDTRALYLREAAEEGLIPVIFDYTDPIRYPDFYDPKYRFDRGHLNEAGAALFTRVIAEDFLAYLEHERDSSIDLH